MPFQYLHTSAKRGLEPGKSGFCCIARDRDIPVDLAKELDRLSRYEHIPGGPSPIIHRYTQLDLRSGSYRILSRIQDSGIDYSKRNNHIAHHLAFTVEEISTLPDPASILLFWRGWKADWNDPPRVLEARDGFDIKNLNTREVAASEIESLPPAVDNGQPLIRSFEVEPGEEFQVSNHIRNALMQLPLEERWQYKFTNFLLRSDKPSNYTWSANWEGRVLPYDLILEPILSSDEEELEADPEPAEKAENEPEVPQKFKAPIVEIPEEFDRSKLKRPKKPWSKARVSRTVNISLIMLGIICICMIVWWANDYQEQSEDLAIQEPQPKSKTTSPAIDQPEPASKRISNAQEAREIWNRLVDNGTLQKEEILADQAAKILADEGDPTPRERLIFVASLEGARDEAYIKVPSDLIGIGPSTSRIDSDYTIYLKDESFVLATKAWELALENLREAGAVLEPVFREHSARAFNKDRLGTALTRVLNQSANDLQPRSPIANRAVEEHMTTVSRLREDKILNQLLTLHEAFGYGEDRGFLVFDTDGLARNTNGLRYASYAQTIFEEFVLPRYASFNQSSGFKRALQKIADKSGSSAMEVVKAIHEAILIARSNDAVLNEQISKIRDAWVDAFVREDLMQETLVDFAIQRLEKDKRSLIELQSQFSASDLRNYHRLQHIREAVAQAEQALEEVVSKDQEWIVIPTKRAHRLPIH